MTIMFHGRACAGVKDLVMIGTLIMSIAAGGFQQLPTAWNYRHKCITTYQPYCLIYEFKRNEGDILQELMSLWISGLCRHHQRPCNMKGEKKTIKRQTKSQAEIRRYHCGAWDRAATTEKWCDYTTRKPFLVKSQQRQLLMGPRSLFFIAKSYEDFWCSAEGSYTLRRVLQPGKLLRQFGTFTAYW